MCFEVRCPPIHVSETHPLEKQKTDITQASMELLIVLPALSALSNSRLYLGFQSLWNKWSYLGFLVSRACWYLCPLVTIVWSFFCGSNDWFEELVSDPVLLFCHLQSSWGEEKTLLGTLTTVISQIYIYFLHGSVMQAPTTLWRWFQLLTPVLLFTLQISSRRDFTHYEKHAGSLYVVFLDWIMQSCCFPRLNNAGRRY